MGIRLSMIKSSYLSNVYRPGIVNLLPPSQNFCFLNHVRDCYVDRDRLSKLFANRTAGGGSKLATVPSPRLHRQGRSATHLGG